MSDDKEAERFQRQLVEIIMKSQVYGSRNEYETLEERKKRYLSDDKYEQVMRRTLRDIVSLSKIRSLYMTWINEEETLDKLHMINALCSKFFGKSTETSKRTLEREILEEMEDIVFHIMPMCGINVPQELIKLILSFLTTNSDLLYKVGTTCKTMYFHVLCMDWSDEIVIEKRNYLQISLLVLQNLTKIVMYEPGFSTDQFTTPELKYLFPRIDGSKLRHLTIDAPSSRIGFIINEFERFFLSDREKNSLRNVDTLVLHTRNLGSFGSVVIPVNYFENKHLPEMLPNLRTIINPPNLQIFHPLPLKIVSNEDRNGKKQSLFSEGISLEEAEKYLPETIEELYICDDHQQEKLCDLILTRLKNLKSVKIDNDDGRRHYNRGFFYNLRREMDRDRHKLFDTFTCHEAVRLQSLSLGIAEKYERFIGLFNRIRKNCITLNNLTLNYRYLKQFVQLICMELPLKEFFNKYLPSCDSFKADFGMDGSDLKDTNVITQFCELVVDEVLIKKRFKNFEVKISSSSGSYSNNLIGFKLLSRRSNEDHDKMFIIHTQKKVRYYYSRNKSRSDTFQHLFASLVGEMKMKVRKLDTNTDVFFLVGEKGCEYVENVRKQNTDVMRFVRSTDPKQSKLEAISAGLNFEDPKWIRFFK